MGSCELSSEPSGSVKCQEFLEWPSNCGLLKKDLAPLSYTGTIVNMVINL